MHAAGHAEHSLRVRVRQRLVDARRGGDELVLGEVVARDGEEGVEVGDAVARGPEYEAERDDAAQVYVRAERGQGVSQGWVGAVGAEEELFNGSVDGYDE